MELTAAIRDYRKNREKKLQEKLKPKKTTYNKKTSPTQWLKMQVIINNIARDTNTDLIEEEEDHTETQNKHKRYPGTKKELQVHVGTFQRIIKFSAHKLIKKHPRI